jgi:DNA-binding transcriptional MerR regulator
MPHPDGTYKTSEVAARLRVAPTTVRRWINDGFLPEPGIWAQGRKRERSYSESWVVSAEKKIKAS